MQKTNNIYKNLSQIHQLFLNNQFNYKAQTFKPNHPYQITYSQKNNACLEFIININANKIETSIPLKNINYFFKTEFQNFEDAYSYLEKHINNHIN